MTNVKPNMDCENCWLIVNEFDGDYACDECVADAVGEGFQASTERQKAVANIVMKRETA